MKKTNKMKKWSCTIVEGDGRPSNICNCGYPFDGRPHTGPYCRPRNVLETKSIGLHLAANGEVLNT